MWFRVELHKDGSVARCDTVEGKLKDGKHVFYVEADTKEKALAGAIAQYRRHTERSVRSAKRRRDERKSRGLCKCGKPLMPGRAQCQQHAEDHRLRVDLYRARQRGEVEPYRRPGLADSALRMKLSRAAQSKLDQARERELFGMGHGKLTYLRASFREALAAYDRNPRNFRNWLVTKLASLGVSAGGEQPAAAE